MLKYTETNKWNDDWHVSLPPMSKLVFAYLCDMCDEAGFIEVNYKVWSLHLNLNTAQIKKALMPLQKALLSDKKSRLWLKNHLKHPNQLPLNKKSDDHKLIIDKITGNLERFDSPIEMKMILDTSVSSKVSKRNNPNFKPPEYPEWSNYYLEQKPDATKMEIESLFLHYQKVDWKVGKNKTKMSDWQAAIRQAISRNKKDNKANKTDTTFKLGDKLS